MIEKPAPILLAMVVCDNIIREEGTKKMNLLGMFNRIEAKNFPAVHSKLHIYIALTEYEGTANCELSLLDDMQKAIVKMNGPLMFPDKLSVVELNFSINNLPLSKAGIYHFEFFVDKKLIGHRKFIVQKIKEE